MKNPFSALMHIDFKEVLQNVVKRFTLPVIVVILMSLVWIYRINTDAAGNHEITDRIIITLLAIFLLSTGMYLLMEREKTKKYIIKDILPLIFGGMFYLSLDGLYDSGVEDITYIILTLSGFFAFVFVAPFVMGYYRQKMEDTVHFSNYFTRIAWTLLMSVVVGAALNILGFVAIWAVTELFELADLLREDKIYAYWAVFALSFVAPLYGLIHLPQPKEYETTLYTKNAFFSFLVKYVATPFIYIYFLILYAYSAKVLFNFSDWPKGVISWMVIGFSSFGYLVYIFSKAYETESKMITLFRKYFPYAILPQVCMLFYAIYLRITQYDFTMNRYFVVVFGLWLTLISLYLIVSKKKALSFIPMILTLLIIMISVGPWSVYAFPLARQTDRLMTNLETAKILQDGKIVPLKDKKDISSELSGEIYSGISYICDFQDCKTIKALFPKELSEEEKVQEAEWKKWNTQTGETYTGLSKWQIVDTVTRAIKVEPTYNYAGTEKAKYLQYGIAYLPKFYPIDTRGYIQLVRIYGERDLVNEKDKTYPFVSFDPDANMISYHESTTQVLKYPFTPTIKTPAIDGYGLEKSDLTFEVKGQGKELKLYFENIAIQNPEVGTGTQMENIYYTINGVALVK